VDFREEGSFWAQQRHVSVFGCSADGPLLVLNMFDSSGKKVWELLQQSGRPFSLIVIDHLLWNHDMAPWDSPPLFKGDSPCTGGADAYLELLVKKILPRGEQMLESRITWRALTGYSLAGLFALYSMYHTDIFQRFASMSGSLWYPGIRAYVLQERPAVRPQALYFSLGDREAEARNPVFHPVLDNTKAIAAHFREEGIPTAFVLHPGGHAFQAEKRMVSGLSWLLQEGEEK
jgi:predicted alpha/beta superfamily hydrolase